MRSGVFFLLFWVVYCGATTGAKRVSWRVGELTRWRDDELAWWRVTRPSAGTTAPWTGMDPARDPAPETPHPRPARRARRRAHCPNHIVRHTMSPPLVQYDGGAPRNFPRPKAPTHFTYSRRRAALGPRLRALQRDNDTNTLLLRHRGDGTSGIAAPRRLACHRRRRTHAGLAQEGRAQIQLKRHVMMI